jgi:hypothetical protein
VTDGADASEARAAQPPLYLLAAIYDHDDDRKVHNALFLKQR